MIDTRSLENEELRDLLKRLVVSVGLRFVKRKVQPFDAGFPMYQNILQQRHGNVGWIDVPVVNEEEVATSNTEASGGQMKVGDRVSLANMPVYRRKYWLFGPWVVAWYESKEVVITADVTSTETTGEESV